MHFAAASFSRRTPRRLRRHELGFLLCFEWHSGCWYVTATPAVIPYLTLDLCCVVPHCGPNNRNLVAHIGLSIPSLGQYQMDVAGEKISWRAGDVVLFDESFRHSVSARPADGNTGGLPNARILLIFRVAHPDLHLPNKHGMPGNVAESK